MSTVTSVKNSASRQYLLLGLGGLVILCLGAAGMYFLGPLLGVSSTTTAAAEQEDHDEDGHPGEEGRAEGETADRVVFPKVQWKTADLKIADVEKTDLPTFKWVTGKLTVNRDQAAEIYPLVEGRVHQVQVRFGETVETGQTLAIVDSREVGQAKLELYRDRRDQRFAEVNREWAKTINTNVQKLISALEDEVSLDNVQTQFQDEQIGQYRSELMTAYADLYKARKDYERLKPLEEKGISAGKDVLAAEAAFKTAKAKMEALLEQIKFTAYREELQAKQEFEKAETESGVSRSLLYILGYQAADLDNLDPLAEGEEISHYPVKAPFAGTIIEKDVVIDERVGPDTKMFELADLSTLWVQADIYQKDLPLLDELQDTLNFRTTSYDHVHEADIFYKGDVLSGESRTVRLLATVENPNGHLKPGMFAQVQLPGKVLSDVLVAPVSAIQRQDDDEFVFVHQKGETFKRQNIVTGTQSENMVVIEQGLQPGDQIVVSGGFALKTKLLSGSVGGTHAH